MKKLFSLLLAAMLVFGLMAGALAADEETLTVWCWDPNFNIFAMREAEKVYQKDHPNFKLNIVESGWDDVQTKIITAASGDMSILPDIFLMQDMAFRKNVVSYPDVFADLTGSSVPFDQFAQSKVGFSVVDGKNYGVPFDSGAAIAAYRTDILEQAGYTVADLNNITWDRLIEIGKDVLAKTGVPMFAFNTADADFPLMILQSMGVSMFDEEGNVNLNNNEGIKKAAEIIQALRDAGIYTELPNWDEYCKANITGGCVGTIQGCWFIGTLTSAADLTGKYAIVNLPKVDGVEGATHFASNGGSSWAVAGNSQKKDLAIDFLSKTYGASVEFYDAILEKAGAIATFLPAGESEAYARPQEFFGGQQVYQDIVEFAGQIPTVIIGVYHYEARDALGVALQEIAAGADVQQALDKAQFDVEFAMGM